MLRSPLLRGYESLAAAVENPRQTLNAVRFEDHGPLVLAGLLIGSQLLPGAWMWGLTLCLTILFCVSERSRRSYVNKYKEAHSMLPKGKEKLTKEELRLKAVSLGLNPEDYDDEEELVAEKTEKSLGVTTRGQAVRCYERALPLLPVMAGKVRLPACGEYTVPIEDQQTEDSHGGPVGVGAGGEDIDPCSEERAKMVYECATLQTRLGVKWVMLLGRACGGSAAAWAKHTGPVVWDIPCSAHPALDKMADLYIEMMSNELRPIGPAWDWMLQRPEERAFNHWSRQPLREQDKQMWYTMERTKPAGHDTTVFGRSAYIFGKWRLKKSIRHTEVKEKMKPLFAELGIETEKNSGQFFYPPGGFRTWHTNVWDGLGFRGYIVHVDRDNMSALNVMKGDRMISCPDKARIFRLFKITGGSKPTWHSVVSDCHRYSLGFKIPDRVARETFMPLANKVYE
jgi:hypothetical protein